MITIKTAEEIELMRRAGKIVASLLKGIGRKVSPGITTVALENYALAIIEECGAVSAFKGYEGYPANICTSVNEEVVHAIPSGRVLKEGDIVSIDVGVKYQGYFADAAITCLVGRVDRRIVDLVRVTKKALAKAIDKARPGNFVSDISNAVESFVASRGFSVVREFVGHGIGKKLHEDPQIPNFGKPHMGEQLKAGMVLAIEPMVNMGAHPVEILSDGWTAVTKDRFPSAHFEHCVLITERGNAILTR
ncbi:MAG: type I methionyl aminopeptidase [Candidatus Omnitrophica bacterium]|nr:type I methionyl aminopeptidase [Candidatus Omnitrophota bacterium]